MRRAAVFAALALLAACERQAGPTEPVAGSAPSDAPSTARAAPSEVAAERSPVAPASESKGLSAEGFGPVRVGMTEAEAARLLGPGVQGVTGVPDDCHMLSLKPAPADLLVMIEGGRVARVTARSAEAAATDRGLTVGATAAQVRQTYGSALQVEPHKYVDAPAEYLTAWASPGQRGVRYVVGQDGRVEEIHAGGPAIQYVEGCS